MRKRKLVFVFFFIFIIFFPLISKADQQTNYMISQPPIPWFEYEKDQIDLKLGGTFFYLSGKVDDELKGKAIDFSLYGGGGFGFFRFAFTDTLAVDIGANIIGARGSYSGALSDPRIFSMSYPLDLEFQIPLSDHINVILFSGASLSITFLYIGLWNSNGAYYDFYIWTTIYGPQLGGQVSFEIGDLVINPFGMVQFLKGSYSAERYHGGDFREKVSGDFKFYTVFNFGFDVIYKPLDLACSTLFQLANSSGQNKDYKTFIISFSYSFHWSGKE